MKKIRAIPTTVSTKSAKGMRGCLLGDSLSGYYFRVYKPDHTFVDYKLAHCDLEVEIVDDDAFFYYPSDTSETPCLDHSPATLGFPKMRKASEREIKKFFKD